MCRVIYLWCTRHTMLPQIQMLLPLLVLFRMVPSWFLWRRMAFGFIFVGWIGPFCSRLLASCSTLWPSVLFWKNKTFFASVTEIKQLEAVFTSNVSELRPEDYRKTRKCSFVSWENSCLNLAWKELNVFRNTDWLEESSCWMVEYQSSSACWPFKASEYLSKLKISFFAAFYTHRPLYQLQLASKRLDLLPSELP